MGTHLQIAKSNATMETHFQMMDVHLYVNPNKGGTVPSYLEGLVLLYAGTEFKSLKKNVMMEIRLMKILVQTCVKSKLLNQIITPNKILDISSMSNEQWCQFKE